MSVRACVPKSHARLATPRATTTRRPRRRRQLAHGARRLVGFQWWRQSTTQRLNRGCQRNPPRQTTGAGPAPARNAGNAGRGGQKAMDRDALYHGTRYAELILKTGVLFYPNIAVATQTLLGVPVSRIVADCDDGLNEPDSRWKETFEVYESKGRLYYTDRK